MDIKYDPDSPIEYVGIQAVSFPATTGNVPLISGDAMVCGWSIIETSGAAPAQLTIMDGSDASGQPIAYVTLAPGQGVNDIISVPGIYCTRGVTVLVTAGSVKGVVWLRDV